MPRKTTTVTGPDPMPAPESTQVKAESKRTARWYVIDSTAWTAVVVCQLCEWRGFSHSKPSAYRQVAAHLSLIHDEEDAARRARSSARIHNRRLSTATTQDGR